MTLLSLTAEVLPTEAQAASGEESSTCGAQIQAQLAGLEQQLQDAPEELYSIAAQKDAIAQSLPNLYTEATALSHALPGHQVLSPQNQEPLVTLDNLVTQQLMTDEVNAEIAKRQEQAAIARAIEAELNSWHSPLAEETEVVSPFGYRIHPVYGYRKFHKGVDLDSEKGDRIVAARSGVVTTAKYHYAGGYYVVIDHGDGFSSEYLHMTNFTVTVGQYVSVGETIGYVGRSGVATGPHLHFGILLDGKYVDPEDYLSF